jgi:hypothetical protein
MQKQWSSTLTSSFCPQIGNNSHVRDAFLKMAETLSWIVDRYLFVRVTRSPSAALEGSFGLSAQSHIAIRTLHDWSIPRSAALHRTTSVNNAQLLVLRHNVKPWCLRFGLGCVYIMICLHLLHDLISHEPSAACPLLPRTST